jgi:four helix bundle protein
MNDHALDHPADPPNRTDRPDPSDSSSRRPRRLRPSGGYRQLRSFQTATILYDATVKFCARFLNPRSRTTDQMEQAARSGRQNIAEGSRAAATSSQTELRLVNVARASLDELLLDYEDFLRQRQLPAWDKNSPEPKPFAEWVFQARPIRPICRIRQILATAPAGHAPPPGWNTPTPPWSPTRRSA